MTDVDKILQMIPAEGWYAIFSGENEATELKALVCFALVEMIDEGGKTTHIVRPMCWLGEFVDFCDTGENFSGVVRADEMEGGPEEEQAKEE